MCQVTLRVAQLYKQQRGYGHKNRFTKFTICVEPNLQSGFMITRLSGSNQIERCLHREQYFNYVKRFRKNQPEIFKRSTIKRDNFRTRVRLETKHFTQLGRTYTVFCRFSI